MNAQGAYPPFRARAAMTLVEVVMVVLLLGIMAAVILPRYEPDIAAQLMSTAELVAADLDYVRSLAVANNTDYEFRVDSSANAYSIRHVGGNPVFDVLPLTNTYVRSSGGKQYDMSLANAPSLGTPVNVLGFVAGEPAASMAVLEFDNLGSPAPPGDAYLWLCAGQGTARRYMAVKIHAVSGLVELLEITSTAPPIGGS